MSDGGGDFAGAPLWIDIVGAFAPFGMALVGLFAAWIARSSLEQRRAADAKSEWWRRVEFALTFASRDEKEVGRNAGMELLTAELNDPLATEEDKEMLAEVVDVLIDEIVAAADGRGEIEPEQELAEDAGRAGGARLLSSLIGVLHRNIR